MVRWNRLLILVILALGLGEGTVASGKSERPCPPSASAPEIIETQFVQLYPNPRIEGTFKRSPGQTRAVLLLPGLKIHPFSSTSGMVAEFHSWQHSGSTLVQQLGQVADVFAFAYSQNASIEAISEFPTLGRAILRLKDLGYEEIVLIGHSAGGLIARCFIENFPDAGVTKVIQVCSPNAGCSSAEFDAAISSPQRAFVESLTRESCVKCFKTHGKAIPEKIQFVCVIGIGGGDGDGVVTADSQWPEDLQQQGIPAVALQTSHFTVMRSRPEAEEIAALVRDKNPRWKASQVASLKKTLAISKNQEEGVSLTGVKK